MRKVLCLLLGAMVAGTGGALIASPPAGASSLVLVCATVKPRQASVNINGNVILSPVVEVPTTCVAG